MMVFELIELLKQQHPHYTVRHMGPYDPPECAAEIHGVETQASWSGAVFLTTAMPPLATPRTPNRES